MKPTPAFDLDAYTLDRISLINAALDRFTPPADTEPAALHTAMRYSLMAKGKRIRPLLCIAGAEAVGGNAESVLPTASALEMLHTFSLIHDDLPAMDNDDFRRGIPTSHKIFGEAIAILAGDALQTLAFATIATHQGSSDPAQTLRAIRLFAEASGSLGMGGGQVDDIHHEGKPITLEILRHIHERKTGALLNASILCGAILSGSTPDQEAALHAYGNYIGVAFQIVDDILDVTGDDAKLGKQTGSDEKKDKATYPKLVGLETATRLACEASECAVAALMNFDDRAEPLRAFARFIVERDM
jgi:geranylgeranyl diphosphate synthase, type II